MLAFAKPCHFPESLYCYPGRGPTPGSGMMAGWQVRATFTFSARWPDSCWAVARGLEL